jgi:hypothetical protein
VLVGVYAFPLRWGVIWDRIDVQSMNVPHFFKIDSLESLSLRVSLKVSILQVPRLKLPLAPHNPTLLASD